MSNRSKNKTGSAATFKPNVSPRKMIELGVFGGTYWRDLKNCVSPNMELLSGDYKKLPEQYWKGLPEERLIKPYNEYDKNINKYKVKTGTTYKFWCEKGWIKPTHPRGWYHWYCNYYYGIKSEYDDEEKRRWERFCGPKGRFRLWLITKILQKNGKWDDLTIAPKIRQNLLEWGYQLTKRDFDNEVKRRKSLRATSI